MPRKKSLPDLMKYRPYRRLKAADVEPPRFGGAGPFCKCGWYAGHTGECVPRHTKPPEGKR